MAVDGVQAEAHGDHRKMGTTCLAPHVQLGLEVVDAAGMSHVLTAEVFDRPAQSGYLLAHTRPSIDASGDVPTMEDEAIGETGRAIERRVA